jgi:hypothetical protein
MRRDILIRFYGVERMNKTDPTLVNVLKEIYKKEHKLRTSNCDGVDLRLENLISADSKWFGEFTRIQSDDFPSEVTPSGRKALSTENDLGHSIVFCYDPATSIMALRSDKMPVSPKKIETYLSNSHPGALFHLFPKMKKDAWVDFKNKPLKKFEVRLAGFTDLDGLAGDDMSAFQGLKSFRDGYNSHTITITMSMGRKKGYLNEKIKATAKSLLNKENDEFEVRSMKAKPADNAPELNLLDQILADKENVELPRNDPDKSFKAVCDALQRALLRNKGNL